MNSNIVKIAAAVIALAAAGYLAWRQYQVAEVDDVQNVMTTFLCEDCKRMFDKTVREVQATVNNETPLACPDCGKSQVSRVFKCPNCTEALRPVGHGSYPEICPHCKKKTS